MAPAKRDAPADLECAGCGESSLAERQSDIQRPANNFLGRPANGPAQRKFNIRLYPPDEGNFRRYMRVRDRIMNVS
jgi:hypothetical protein